MKKVDLHLHTTASDGSYTPEELVEKAVEMGLETIAVSDHDTVAGIGPALAAAKGVDLEVVSGVELTTYVGQEEVHILGYCFDYLDQDLLVELNKLKEARKNRGKKIVEKLNKLGLDLEWEKVTEVAGSGAVGRPHIARALVNEGYVDDISAAFDNYIADQGPAYVPKTQLTPKEAIEIINKAGGIAVLAHPGHLSTNELVIEIIESGIDGIEAYYSGHDEEETEKYIKLATRYDLLITGGSDCHGPKIKEGILLGTVDIPRQVVDNLKSTYRDIHDITLIDFEKYLNLYPETSGLYPDKLQEIGDKYHDKGYLTKEELHNLAYLNSTRSSYHVKKNSPDRIKKITEIAYNLTDEFSQLTLLTGLLGVGIPTASAILTSLDENNHTVIDTRVWATLYHMGYFDKEKESFNADDYIRIINIVRRLANKTGLTTAEIGYALFAYDVEHRKGTLH
ncbi:PHP domain-containing protein [Sporohalobacter salinus]|uniref:PHP domain-containing protein n=1 Tax=Sporohalobacter salinus TaxID=1494606 RepID=UPI001EF95C0A|nr:PHP domain-containing protein [Sporohalobacter salinus]MBM7623005.1 putative metal-dependent phosphoesterase TrpH/thermostable 8-oxoguanine DNA glycosylase [Sporohalobacter salinus]